MEEKLRNIRIKITPQRLQLLKTLEELEGTHPSFNTVYNKIHDVHPNISRSTVHENLKLLVAKDIIRNFYFKGETRYEMNLEPHINIAEANGSIHDINNKKISQKLEEIKRLVEEEEGKEIKKIMVVVE